MEAQIVINKFDSYIKSYGRSNFIHKQGIIDIIDEFKETLNKENGKAKTKEETTKENISTKMPEV